jgi:hypothetical protein
MKRTLTRFGAIMALACALLLGARAWAMSSTTYRLDWFTPLNSSGGGPASSANYKANFTVGQTVIGKATSANYRIGLGYWYVLDPASLFLPSIQR